jgi:hypothetical protein
MSKTVKLNLKCGLREVTGCGDDLTFRLRGWRTNARGNHEEYELELEACRFAVRSLMIEIRKMHLRDRERLQREEARIQREVRELTQEQA